jgi:hypothetical protein
VLKAGLKTAIDISIIEQAKDAYFQEILKLINNLDLPDLEDGDGNYLRQNTFEIVEETEKCEFTTDVPKNAIVLKNRKISAVARSGSFRYKVAPLIVAKGHAEVDMNTVEIDVGLAFSTTTTSDGRVIPYVTAVDVKCNINRFDINIKLWGDFITDFASIFEVFFVGTVAGLIEDTIKLTLNQGIPLVTNTILKKSNGFLPLPIFPGWVVDYQTPAPILVSDVRCTLGYKALFFDKLIGEEESTGPIPDDMPYHMDTHLEKF